MSTTSDRSYTRTLTADETAERIFQALTDPDAIGSRWSAASTTGSGRTGGELAITVGTQQQPTVMRVLGAHPSDAVIWEVVASPLVPQWAGTRPTFTMTVAAGGCRLDFADHGPVPHLECFERCATDWGRSLLRLCAHARDR